MLKNNLKILYLQIRNDEITAKEELQEFVRFSGLEEAQFRVLNTFETPHFGNEVIKDCHAVFVGGSSDASVLKEEEYPFVKSIKNLLKHCAEISFPVFASCFGFQAAVEALGGKVILDKENMEMGTYEICLTEEASSDLLFKDAPNKFFAVSGHKERAVSLPENAINLAYSKACPFHSFKLKEKPFYAFQFHPEVDKGDLITRIIRYKERYLDDDGALQKIIDSSVETPFSNSLVKIFIERVLL